jgi:hypothetical protein
VRILEEYKLLSYEDIGNKNSDNLKEIILFIDPAIITSGINKNDLIIMKIKLIGKLNESNYEDCDDDSTDGNNVEIDDDIGLVDRKIVKSVDLDDDDDDDE